MLLFSLCSRYKMLESELESSLKKSLQIKEDKMAALEARLQESSSLNQELRQELRTVSRAVKVLLGSHLRKRKMRGTPSETPEISDPYR